MNQLRKPGFADEVLAATAALRDETGALAFADPVAWVYNPLDYAWNLHEQYVRKWGATPRRVLMMGMNPGPWGMAQTGVPFGEVAVVRDFLGLSGRVDRSHRLAHVRTGQKFAAERRRTAHRR